MLQSTGGKRDTRVERKNAMVIDRLPGNLAEAAAHPRKVIQWKHLRDMNAPNSGVKGVYLLIGLDCPDALRPLETRRGNKGKPFAIRTPQFEAH